MIKKNITLDKEQKGKCVIYRQQRYKAQLERDRYLLANRLALLVSVTEQRVVITEK